MSKLQSIACNIDALAIVSSYTLIICQFGYLDLSQRLWIKNLILSLVGNVWGIILKKSENFNLLHDQNKIGHCLLISTDKVVVTPDKDDKTVAHCLTLPGKILHLTPLLNQKKFRGYGNKETAVRAFFSWKRVRKIIGPSRVNPVIINVHV